MGTKSHTHTQGVIRNDIAIVKGLTFGIGIGSTVVGSGIFWITVITIAGFGTEDLSIVLAALSINHTGSFFVCLATGTMHHALCDCGIESGMGNRVRDLSRDDGVDMSSITNFKVLLQKDEEMDVRQTTLLKLDGEDESLNIPKEAVLYVFEHGLDLLSKDTCNNVRSIRRCLTFPGLIRDIKD